MGILSGSSKLCLGTTTIPSLETLPSDWNGTGLLHVDQLCLPIKCDRDDRNLVGLPA